MKTTTNPPQPGRVLLSKVMKAFIFVCWGLMLVGLISVIAAGHTGPAGIMALGGAMACLGGTFFLLYQSMHRLGLGKHHLIEGKRLALLFVLTGASMLLMFLTVGLD